MTRSHYKAQIDPLFKPLQFLKTRDVGHAYVGDSNIFITIIYHDKLS